MATSTNLGMYLPTRDDYISVKRDITDNLEIIDEAVGANTDGVSKLDSGLAYVAVKVGSNWQMPSGKTAQNGDYVIVNGVVGHATATLTGGSTNIVENTNWVAETAGGLNSLSSNISSLSEQIGHINTTTTITNLSNIQVNSQGRIRLDSTVSPTGVSANFNYQCYGTSDVTTLVVAEIDNNRTWTNTYYQRWRGWTSLNDQIENKVQVRIVNGTVSSISGKGTADVEVTLNSAFTNEANHFWMFNNATNLIFPICIKSWTDSTHVSIRVMNSSSDALTNAAISYRLFGIKA